jgi:aminopeptidase
MHEPCIDAADLAAWAKILIDHSLGGVAPGERVMLKGEPVCWPLLEVLERDVILAGGLPDVLLVPPNNERGRVWSAAMAAHGTREQIAATPAWHRDRYESMTKYVEVLGAEDPAAYASLTAPQRQALAQVDEPFWALRLARRWVLTLYPTPAFAAAEGLPFDEYVRFIVAASTADPRPLKAAAERLAPLLEHGRSVEIVTVRPDGRELLLKLDITPSLAALSFGLSNLPDGEVYTSPDARATVGEIFLDLPVYHGGQDMRGIYLRFEEGRVVEHTAEEGGELLAAIVGTDEGARRLGEVALGLNRGLGRALKHPLLAEKVGGTLHIALGDAIEHCFVTDPASAGGKTRLAELASAGVLNHSAQHVDIVADFRPGGCGRRVAIDGQELVVRDGGWLLPG